MENQQRKLNQTREETIKQKQKVIHRISSVDVKMDAIELLKQKFYQDFVANEDNIGNIGNRTLDEQNIES